MPPKKGKNVLLMVTNIGSTSLYQNSLEDEPFIDKAKYAMKSLVEKKIFVQPKDEIGIITMGDETNNPEDLDNINLYHENLLHPNWEMVKYINQLSSTDYACNWIEALFVALSIVQAQVNEPARIFIVIFNNFKEDADSINEYDSDIIIDRLSKDQRLFLLFVGENPICDESWQEHNISPSEKFVLELVNQNVAQYEVINDFIQTRKFYISPAPTPAAWNFKLEWAGIFIPCAEYVQVQNDYKFSPWKMQAVDDDSQNLLHGIADVLGEGMISKPRNTTTIVRQNVKVDMHRNEIEPHKMINGYKFGGKFIPFSDEDEIAMKYSGSERGMKIYGFVSKSEVKLEYWSGNGARIVVPKENPELFYSFVQAMAEKDYVAIVRKVFAKFPKMGVLFPRLVDDEIWCLVHLELPFIHDIRRIEKKPIKSFDKEINEEKLDALDDFIDSMTISNDEHTYLNPGMFPDVVNQYRWNAMADRALHPDRPLLPFNDYLRKYLVPPEDLSLKAKPHLEKLNKLFTSCGINKDTDKTLKPTSDIQSNELQEKNNANKVSNNSMGNESIDQDFFSPDDVDLQIDELNNL